MSIGLSFLLWYIVGCLSFVYWWTRQFTFSMSELPVMLLAGFVGPAAFIIGFILHGGKKRKM